MPDVMKNQGRRKVDDSVARHQNICVSEGEKTTLATESWLPLPRIQHAPTEITGVVSSAVKKGMFHQFDETLTNNRGHPSCGERMPTCQVSHCAYIVLAVQIRRKHRRSIS